MLGFRSLDSSFGIIATTSSAASLYGPAPFFCYPWKPLLNSIYGGGYVKSYRHFRMQHMDGLNLALHCLCLFWQLSSNYALLQDLDEVLMSLAKKLSLPVDQSSHLVSRLTSLIWSVHLLATSPTPRVVKLASVACIYLAHNHLELGFLNTGATFFVLKV